MFATDQQKIMAHVYKPEYVLDKFEEVVVPLFKNAYGFEVDNDQELAQQLVQDTFTYNDLSYYEESINDPIIINATVIDTNGYVLSNIPVSFSREVLDDSNDIIQNEYFHLLNHDHTP